MILADPAGDPVDESARLAALNHYSDLYSLPEQAFDDLNCTAMGMADFLGI